MSLFIELSEQEKHTAITSDIVVGSIIIDPLMSRNEIGEKIRQFVYCDTWHITTINPDGEPQNGWVKRANGLQKIEEGTSSKAVAESIAGFLQAINASEVSFTRQVEVSLFEAPISRENAQTSGVIFS